MSGKINAFILPKNMDFLSERIFFLSSLKPFHIFFICLRIYLTENTILMFIIEMS